MARYKGLLIGCEFVTAGRARKCYHSPKHDIRKGDRVFEVQVGFGRHGYCLECAREMLRCAEEELAMLRQQLPRAIAAD